MSRLYCLAWCLLAFACSPKKKNKNAYVQSALIHNSMVMKANEMEHAIYDMMHDSLPLAKHDSLQSILADLKEWQKQMEEVHGNGNQDHKNHEHHNTPAQLTPEQMLQVQKELDGTLGRIGKRLNQLNDEKL